MKYAVFINPVFRWIWEYSEQILADHILDPKWQVFFDVIVSSFDNFKVVKNSISYRFQLILKYLIFSIKLI